MVALLTSARAWWSRVSPGRADAGIRQNTDSADRDQIGAVQHVAGVVPELIVAGIAAGIAVLCLLILRSRRET
jgi:hypothetical protein